ncbi:MAG: PKD domain-containing protein [Paludibacter sp.]|nr:PKD domain-containing protein [Paludibacter sp.]
MKTKVFHSLFSFLLVMLFAGLNAAEPYCTNLGFELKNFTNWKAYTWIDRQNSTPTPKVEGVVANRHALIAINGFDAVVGRNLLKLIPDGYNTSAKLGSTFLGTGGLRQSLIYTIDVTENNAFILYRFAVVLQDPFDANHQKIDEPRFKVTILDELENEIPDCANYDVYGSDARIGGWQLVPNTRVYWRDWTAVGINLSKFIGRKVTLEFMSANCRRTGHYGYAYFTAECQPLFITVDYCAGNQNATLISPSGFESYNWKNNAGITVGTNQSLILAKPGEGDTYTCLMKSATGCDVELSATVFRYEPNAVFKNDLIDCSILNNTIKFYISNPPTRGTLDYFWEFGDGVTSTEKQPVHAFESVSGWIPVTLTVKNPPSTCFDRHTKLIEIFNPPKIRIDGDTTYCPNETVTLKGYGADHYSWKLNGVPYSIKDSITVAPPGGLVELTGFTSNNECSTIKYRTVIEKPFWPFTATPDTLFCKGESAVLRARGAKSYRWNPGNITTSFLEVKTPGIYTVTGTNPNDCVKSITINVAEVALPIADFTVNPAVINSRYNEITASVTNPLSDLKYYWDFGDGGTDALKHQVSYKYKNLTQVSELKKVTLRSVNKNGCDSITTQLITVTPFFPNVFTPNGDGINDNFLKGMEIQVMDRYGVVLYKGSDGWNGKINNNSKDMDPDTYFYYASYTDHKGLIQTRKGYVTLIRVR